VCAAAALASLEVIDDEALVEASARTGETVLQRLRQQLQAFSGRIFLLDGRGLFISIHLRRPGTDEPDIELADAIAAEAVRRGVMMFVTGRGYLKVVPPLCIDPVAACEAVDVIGDCFADMNAD
jgi:4-aminobutyrate aminotransferase-like enzyme